MQTEAIYRIVQCALMNVRILLLCYYCINTGYHRMLIQKPKKTLSIAFRFHLVRSLRKIVTNDQCSHEEVDVRRRSVGPRILMYADLIAEICDRSCRDW